MKRPARLIALLLGVIGLALIGLSQSKNITFVVNGESQVARSFAFTVGQALAEAGYMLGPYDSISPPLESWLWKDSAIHLDHASQVAVFADGQAHWFQSLDDRPANLLGFVDVPLYTGDLVWVDGIIRDPAEILEPATQRLMAVQRAVTVHLQDGEEKLEFLTTAPTLGQALWDQGVHLLAGDEIEPGLATPLSNDLWEAGIHVSLNRSKEYTVYTAEDEIRIRSAARTVGEALAENGLALLGMDYSLPAADEVPASGIIRVVRVVEEVIVEQEPIPFDVEYRPLEDLEIDNQQIVQTGEYGIAARRVRVIYEDGQEVARQVEEEWMARQPKNRVIGYGTKLVMHSVDTPDGTINYWRALQMWATSYHPATTSNTTASGLPLKKGVVAIDRRYIPFYTRMYVPGYGDALAADVGGGVKGRWIDLGYSDDDYVPWARWVTVYFLWPPPENIVWIIP
jgi:resuscitation-promoting factor RpfB